MALTGCTSACPPLVMRCVLPNHSCQGVSLPACLAHSRPNQPERRTAAVWQERAVLGGNVLQMLPFREGIGQFGMCVCACLIENARCLCLWAATRPAGTRPPSSPSRRLWYKGRWGRCERPRIRALVQPSSPLSRPLRPIFTMFGFAVLSVALMAGQGTPSSLEGETGHAQLVLVAASTISTRSPLASLLRIRQSSFDPSTVPSAVRLRAKVHSGAGI